ncbi:hypothetical protein JCM3775_004709, partial [Rhodotorula graminis]
MQELQQRPEGTVDFAQQLAPPHGAVPGQPPASSTSSTKRPRSPPQGPAPVPHQNQQQQQQHAGDMDAEGEFDPSLPDLLVHRAANGAEFDHLVLPTPPAHLFGQNQDQQQQQLSTDTTARATASNDRVGQQQQNAVAGPSSSATGAGGAAGTAQDGEQGKDVAVRDGPEDLPGRDAFEAAVEEYLQGLHAIKRTKALMGDELHDLVRAILREPQNTKQGDPQMRFWVRQRFTLLAAPEGDSVVHEDKKVVLRSHLFDTISAAHVAAEHGGRDKTFAEVRKHWSYVPKEVVVLYIRLCPTCGGKRVTVRGKRPQGDKRIPLPQDVLTRPADDGVPDTSGFLPKLRPAPTAPAATADSTKSATDIPLSRSTPSSSPRAATTRPSASGSRTTRSRAREPK